MLNIQLFVTCLHSQEIMGSGDDPSIACTCKYIEGYIAMLAIGMYNFEGRIMIRTQKNYKLVGLNHETAFNRWRSDMPVYCCNMCLMLQCYSYMK